MKNTKTIVISPGNSGGGAVFDYLRSRGDFISPFQTEEFRMVADPDGLNDLYHFCFKSRSLYSTSLAIERFLEYNQRLANLRVTRHNKKIKLCKNGYEKIIQNFIKKITDFEYFAIPQFYRMRLNKFSKTKIFINEKISLSLNKSRPFKIVSTKNEDFFINQSKKLIDQIILNNLNNKKSKKNIVIDQAANILNPLESSIFFGNRKIIIVLRDPRSVYASMKKRKSFGFPGYDIKIFVKWFKKTIDHITKINSKLILKIYFEDFILHKKKNIKKIEKFLKLKNEKNISFDFEKSQKNIFKALDILTKKELNYINKELKKYFIW